MSLSNQILDEKEAPKREIGFAALRIKSYFFHLAAQVLLYAFVMVCYVFLEAYIPSLILDILPAGMMIGCLALTIVLYAKGFLWDWTAGFILGVIAFFIAFVYVMNELSSFINTNLDYLTNLFHLPEDLAKDILDIMVVAFWYSILIVPISEVFVFIRFLYLRYKNRNH